MGLARAVVALGLVVGLGPGQISSASAPPASPTGTPVVPPRLLVLGAFDQPVWREALEQALRASHVNFTLRVDPALRVRVEKCTTKDCWWPLLGELGTEVLVLVEISRRPDGLVGHGEWLQADVDAAVPFTVDSRSASETGTIAAGLTAEILSLAGGSDRRLKRKDKVGEGSFAAPIALTPGPRQLDDRPVCDRGAASPTLPPDRVWRCAGVPFELTFPLGLSLEQRWGNGWVSLQSVSDRGVLLVTYRPDLWVLNRSRWPDAAGHAKRLLASVGVDRLVVGPAQELALPHADYAIRQALESGPVDKPITGTALAVIARGWFVSLIVTGAASQALTRDAPAAEAFLGSVALAASSEATVLHRFARASIALPTEAWLMDGPRATAAVYYVPSTGMMVQLAEGDAPEVCSSLTELQWRRVAGDVTPDQAGSQLHFVRNRWFTVGEAKALLSEAEIPDPKNERGYQPAGALMICSEKRFYQIFAIGRAAPLPVVVEQLEAMLRSFAANPNP